MPSLATTALLPESLLGNTIAGKYQLRAVLGCGGMGAVFRASRPEGADVAVKVIHERDGEVDAITRKRAAREASACGRLNHPNVVQVIDAGEDEGSRVPFVVMEMLHGEDLAQAIRRLGPLPPTAVVRIFRQALLGLQAAHDLGLVHRDIKPSNLFLHGTEEVICKICDFGIVKPIRQHGAGQDTTSTLTRQDAVIGSPRYMSPEQARSRHVEFRADLWSAGVALYEALSAESPWGERETYNELVGAILHEQPRPLRSVAPWVPSGIERVLDRALAKDPEQRFANSAEFREALEPWCDGSDLIPASMIRALTEQERLPVEDPNTLAETRAHLTPSHPVGWRWPLLLAGAIALFVAAVVRAATIGQGSPPATVSATPVSTSSTVAVQSGPVPVPSASTPASAEAPAPPGSQFLTTKAPKAASPPQHPPPKSSSAPSTHVPSTPPATTPSPPPVATKVVTEEWQ